MELTLKFALPSFCPGNLFLTLQSHLTFLNHLDGSDDEGLVGQTLHDLAVALRVVPGEVHPGLGIGEATQRIYRVFLSQCNILGGPC